MDCLVVATGRAGGAGAAFLAGRDYVAPDDVKDIAVAVCAHRLGMRSEMTAIDRGGVIRTIIAGIALPLA